MNATICSTALTATLALVTTMFAACATPPATVAKLHSASPRPQSPGQNANSSERHTSASDTDTDTDADAATGAKDEKATEPSAGSQLPATSVVPTWREAVDRYSHTCPVPFFELATPDVLVAGDRTFERLGSVLKVKGGPWSGPLRIGVLAALKDADPETRENIRRAARKFKAAGVHLALVNGDVVGNEIGVLPHVLETLGKEIPVPILVHSGNYEWTSAFMSGLEKASATWPQIINMNLIRHIDMGGFHVVALPGYFNRHFMKPGACHYDDADVAVLERRLKDITTMGEVPILVSHGPPRSIGDDAIDFAYEAGNVGDERLTRVITDASVPFGIFSHILEAGGRAQLSLESPESMTLPMRAGTRTLYVNAGSASSYSWPMHDKSISRGMAAIVTFEGSGSDTTAQVRFLKLR